MLDFNYSINLFGFTRTFNQVSLQPDNSKELYEIIERMSDALLVPFQNNPFADEVAKSIQIEKNCVLQTQRIVGKEKIQFQLLDKSPIDYAKKEISYLVGDEIITAEAWAYNYVGFTYLLRNQFEYALDYFVKSIESSPMYIHALSNLALAYDNLGLYDKAVGYLKEAPSINPKDENINDLLSKY